MAVSTIVGSKYVANRKFEGAGRWWFPGQIIDATGWRLTASLVDHRYMSPLDPTVETFTIEGQEWISEEMYLQQLDRAQLTGVDLSGMAPTSDVPDVPAGETTEGPSDGHTPTVEPSETHAGTKARTGARGRESAS